MLFFWPPSTARAQSAAPAIGCEEAEEAKCLAATGGLATRSGERLTLSFAAGRKRSFDGNAKACGGYDNVDACKKYFLLGYLPGKKIYVVQWSAYEGGGYRLFKFDSGEELVLGDRPVFSPDGARLAAMADTEPGSVESPFGVWRLDRFPPSRELEAQLKGDWEVSRWIDKDTIEVSQMGSGEQKKAFARFAEGKWKIDFEK
ncbi:hypothetical protein [Methylosinus sp. R-45379]|uniref:hypothetical protein n=2 Tax=unclassified Methylosinus TaxID=2624500 RepID=UPI0012ED4712|nr:hypothetical protein [Methylosinus sp. R-45379]